MINSICGNLVAAYKKASGLPESIYKGIAEGNIIITNFPCSLDMYIAADYSKEKI